MVNKKAQNNRLFELLWLGVTQLLALFIDVKALIM